MATSMEQFTDHVSIRDLRVDCIVGVHDIERGSPQPLVADLDMILDLDKAAREGRISETVDYSLVADEVGFILRHAQFQMIETAARAILRYVLAPPVPGRRATVERARITLSKPQALSGLAIPSVEMERSRDCVLFGEETKDFGTVDIIDESLTAGIYRLNIKPGGTIPLHIHREMFEAEKVLTRGLLCQSEPVARGTEFVWPKEEPHRYDNPTAQLQSILCIDRPRFIARDEVVIHE